jgi:hypothetical protein
MLRKRTTGPGVPGPTNRSERPVKENDWPEWRITPARLSRAVFELRASAGGSSTCRP